MLQPVYCYIFGLFPAFSSIFLGRKRMNSALKKEMNIFLKKVLTKEKSFGIISNVDTLVWLNGRAADL